MGLVNRLTSRHTMLDPTVNAGVCEVLTVALHERLHFDFKKYRPGFCKHNLVQ